MVTESLLPRRHLRRRLSLALLGLLLAFQSSRAQDVAIDTVSTPLVTGLPAEHQISLAFEHTLSLYDWHATTVLSQPIGNGNRIGYNVVIGADSRLRQETDLLTTSITALLTGREQVLDDGLLSPFISLFGTSYAASTPSGALPPPSLIRQQVDGFAVAGLSSQIPSSSFVISGAGGVARQSQSYTSTYGSIFLLTLDSAHESIGESTDLFASGSGDERFFNERAQRYSNDRIALSTLSTFREGHNVAAISGGLGRRDFFYTTDSAAPPAKQERRELSLLVLDSLRAPLFTPDLSAIVSLELEPHSISRRSDVAPQQLIQTSSSALSSLLVPNDVSSLRFSARAGADLSTSIKQSGDLSAHAELRYEEHSEDVRLESSAFNGSDGAAIRKFTAELEEASFSSRVTSVGLDSRMAFSNSDTLHVGATSRLLNYDTPSEDNHDDHDELVTGLVLGFGHRFTEDLATLLELRAARSHLVYLKSDRSSQNNVTQSMTFASGAAYFGDRWISLLGADVFANYTVLDYLDSLPILQSVGSYVIRGMTLHDTTRLDIGSLIRPIENALELNADLRLSERGSYNPSAFSERRSTRITELTTSGLLNFTSPVGLAPWMLKLGAKGFFLSREGESTGALLSGETFGELERQTRIGPYAELQLRRADGQGPVLYGSIWYSVLRDEETESATVYLIPKLESHLEVRWTF